MGLVRGVTKENYTKLAEGFCALNEGVAHCICPVSWVQDHEEKPATPQQWSAWRNYFRVRNIRMPLMDQFECEGKPFTVPSLWPHEFDADWAIADDYSKAA